MTSATNMASPLRAVYLRFFSHYLSPANCSVLTMLSRHSNNVFRIRTVYRNLHIKRGFGVYRVGKCVSAGLCLVGGVSVFTYVRKTSDLMPSLSAAKSATLDQTAKPTRMVL